MHANGSTNDRADLFELSVSKTAILRIACAMLSAAISAAIMA